MRFLIVDDDASWRYVLERMLQTIGYTAERGHRIDHAANGGDCLPQVAATKVDVIFMDGNLGPGSDDGPTIVRALRGCGCRATIVMTSGDPPANQQGIDAGADGYRDPLDHRPLECIEHLLLVLRVPPP